MGAALPLSSETDLTTSNAPRPRFSVWKTATALRLTADPRLCQLFFLGGLLAAGVWLRDFSLRPAQVALTVGASLLAQHLLSRLSGRTPVAYRSALITSLGLVLLLRADNLWAHPLAAALAILSKFVIRVRCKHLFNPANLGVICALTLLPGTWVSPGQWGQDVTFAGWLLVLGMVVSRRARRDDISWTFLAFYLGQLALRTAWLGQRWAVWAHQLGNGALLLFAFFMISDPMTIPNRRCGRVLHAAIVAAGAFAWQFTCYRTNGLLWSLTCAAPLVPFWDAMWPAPKYEWNKGVH